MGTICISSILTEIIELFPQYDTITIQFLATTPCFVIIIVSLITGQLATFIPKKILMIVTAFLFMITALGGFFFHDSILLLYVWEIFLGAAIGIFIPIGTSLIADHFSGDERSGMMGLQSSVISIGGVILSLIGGFLATISWYYNYLAFLLILPGFFIIIFGLPMDKPIPKSKLDRIKIDFKIVILYGLVNFLLMLLFNVIPTNLALFLSEHEISGSVNAGISSAVLTFSGVIAGFLFKKISRVIGDKAIAMGFGLMSLGALITAISSSYPFILIGIFIAGFSISLVMAQSMLSITNKVNAAVLTMTVAIILAINNLGAFLSPYFTKISRVLVGENVSSRYILVGILAFIATIFFLFVFRQDRKKL
jgi:MFS family permease